jgi:hypothetical protein
MKLVSVAIRSWGSTPPSKVPGCTIALPIGAALLAART